jgi:uncharacterized protein with NRDE domain
MCTVSWIRKADGYVLLCNRDERFTRKPAQGPQIRSLRGVSYVAPVDGDHGGSWIGVNQSGVTLCLLNHYGDRSIKRDEKYVSRGSLLKDLLDSLSSREVVQRVDEMELDRFQPFTLLVVSAGDPAISIQWTGAECIFDFCADACMPLTSSSLKDPKVVALRQKLFAEMLSKRTALDTELLHQFHRSHWPERGRSSVCMHRDDAATVSLSIVTVDRDTIEFRYQPDSPCLETQPQQVLLKRNPLRSEAAAL